MFYLRERQGHLPIATIANIKKPTITVNSGSKDYFLGGFGGTGLIDGGGTVPRIFKSLLGNGFGVLLIVHNPFKFQIVIVREFAFRCVISVLKKFFVFRK